MCRVVVLLVASRPVECLGYRGVKGCGVMMWCGIHVVFGESRENLTVMYMYGVYVRHLEDTPGLAAGIGALQLARW